MKARQIGGGLLLASALTAGWLLLAPPWAGDAGVPAVVASGPAQGEGGGDAQKKGPVAAPSQGTATATAATSNPAQPVVVAAARPVTGAGRAYGYGVMDENGQVIPPPRPAGVTEIRPGMPENETTGTERGHDRGPNFNLGLYRTADGSVYRP